MKPNIGKFNRTTICMLQHCQGTNEKRHYCPLTPDISEHYHFHFLVTYMVRGGTKDSKCAAESQEKHSSKGVGTVLCIPTNKLFLFNFTLWLASHCTLVPAILHLQSSLKPGIQTPILHWTDLAFSLQSQNPCCNFQFHPEKSPQLVNPTSVYHVMVLRSR